MASSAARSGASGATYPWGMSVRVAWAFVVVAAIVGLVGALIGDHVIQVAGAVSMIALGCYAYGREHGFVRRRTAD